MNNKIIGTPLITYTNADLSKFKIYKENRRKSGVYRWNNLITGKCYVGSSVSLSRRFSQYYSLNYLNNCLSKGQSIIYSSLLKYGYSNFSLDILEYCEPSIVIEREQYYINLLKPEYNILKIAGSCLGNKLSDKTK
jgi:group I intron endonuclease